MVLTGDDDESYPVLTGDDDGPNLRELGSSPLRRAL